MTDSTQPAPLPFTPVLGRARHDGWTPERQRRFVDALATAGTVAAAARAVGMSARSAYGLRRRAGEDSAFARAWDAALDAACTGALVASRPLVLEGERVPVFYGGRQVGEYRRHDSRLALAVLRAVAARQERRAPGHDARAAPVDRAAALHSALDRLASSLSRAETRDDRELPPPPGFRNDTGVKP